MGCKVSAAIGVILAITPLSATIGRPAESFRYTDAEVLSPDGAAKLLQRIREHARSECSRLATPPVRNPGADRCARERTKEVVAKINSPFLTAIAGRAH